MFKHLDRDEDGYLSTPEMPAALRADLRRWDRNGDGLISLTEYHDYFLRRLDHLHQEYQRHMERPPPDIEVREEAERPMVIRAGKLPPGLPAWFDQLDQDRDGQVALYEWRRAGWDLAEFKKLDLNDDGLLVPEEVLKLLATMNRDGTRPYAYLLQKQVRASPHTSKLMKKGFK